MTIKHIGQRISEATLLAVCCGAALTGCATHAIVPATHGASPSASGDGEIKHTQSPVGMPKSGPDALIEATRTINADQEALYEILKLKLPGDSLREFEAGSYLKVTSEFINALGDDSTFIGVSGQAPVWLMDDAMSMVSPLLSDGKSYPYGIVRALGWFQSRGSLEYKSDPPPAPAPLVPYEVVLKYDPSKSVWHITDETDLTNQPEAPICSVPQN